MTIPDRQRWLTLYILCIGVLMIVLDTTIVTVALPSIKTALGFSETNLVWVVNAYMLTFGGFLLLGGRLGDLYGQRKLFLMGLTLFTVASLVCGIAGTQTVLIAARAVQGIGGAVLTAVALALITGLFPQPDERAKAMGIYSFVCAAGGSLGALLGGVLTELLNWRWIFLVNLPIGIVVFVWCGRLLPAAHTRPVGMRLDLAGAATVTLSLMLAVYAVVNGNQWGWLSPRTLTMLGVAGALLAAFLVIESRVRDPMMPLAMFCHRNLSVANVIGMLWAAGMFAWFFLAALYLQLVLGYGPMAVGLAFVPADLIMAIFSLGLSAWVVVRYGQRVPVSAGLALATLGLLLFARAPLVGNFWIDVLPGMSLLGLGAGLAFNPLLLAAMGDVEEKDAGLASGIVNTSFMMGGALGLAVLASLADARTASLRAAGTEAVVALNGGYQLAFIVGAVFTTAAALLGLLLHNAKSPVATTPAH
ncbi:MAG: DHA2 family efflux MFS transporter permease subunit [Pseudomonadota bacterium]